MAWLKNNYQFEFTDTLTTSWTSVRISNEKENGAVATFTNQYITVRSEDNSIVERMKGSATGGTLTLTMRWLDQTDTDTEIVGLKKERREWSKAFVTYVASQHVDAKGSNTFTGTQTFENISVSNNSALTNATVSGKYKWPVVADVTARDLLYPTPVWGNEVFVQSLNAKQVYNAGTVQRETQAVGTPAPDASEIVKGILPLATNAEAITGSNDTKAMTPLKTKAAIDNNWSSLKETSTILLWEDCLINDSLFPETAPTFAESTTVQNIGDVTANTRVVLYDFGSGISWNTMQLALRKFVSPSADLSIRLETVDVSGNPTGTLVNANATATVTEASLTTSLSNTTITFPWSFTITKWQKVGIVLNQIWDIVSGTNYYGLWYSQKNTTTRWNKVFNWTTRSNIIPTTVNDAHWFTSWYSATVSTAEWFKFTASKNILVQSVTKDNFSLATRAIIKDNWWNVITTANFSWNVATFADPIPYQIWEIFRIECDANGAGYNRTGFNTYSFPTNKTNISYTTWSIWWIDQSNLTSNILSINTIEQWFSKSFVYTWSSLLMNTLLSKTNSVYSYKIPTDFPRIANEAKSAGQSVITSYYGLKWWFTGLSNTTYYLWNTPWSISTTQGTNPYVIGNGIDATTLKIDWKNLNKPITVSASPFSYTNTTWWPIQVRVTGGTVNPIVINGVTVATATWIIETLPAWAVMTVTYTVLPTITYSDI